MVSALLTRLRSRPDWQTGLSAAHHVATQRGARAEADAQAVVARYEGRRAVMVFDAVASRQRRYNARVLPMAKAFSESLVDRSLAALAASPPSERGLRPGEGETMRAVAEGLVRFAVDHEVAGGDEETVRAWADWVDPLRFAPALDPYVGAVRGIGPALFAYVRLLSGGDALKPDVRTRASLRKLGFDVPTSDLAVLLVAEGVALELGIRLPVLDQLLWSMTEPD